MKTDVQLTPHFNLKEFLHKGSAEGLTDEIFNNLRRLAKRLEEVRKLIGNKPMIISSAFRSWKHHVEVYKQLAKKQGIPFDLAKVPKMSWHLKGLAVDFEVPGMTSAAVRKILNPIWDGGMELGTVHVHLDLGPKRRFYP